MRKYNIKRAVSKLLAASMVLTMLAPAIPAYAQPEPGAGEIQFHIGSTADEDVSLYEAYTGNQNPTITGTVPDVIGGLNNAPTNPDGRYYVPFYDGTNYNGGATPATWIWDGGPYDFPGYKMEGWYENKTYMAGGWKAEVLPSRYPYSGKRYIGRLMSDGTLYNWTVEYEGADLPAVLKPVHTGTGGGTSPETDLQGSQQVLTGLVVTPKTIPGFKVDIANMGTKFYEPGTTTQVTPIASADNYSFKTDPRGFVQGIMTNKDVKINIPYLKDNTQKFNVIIKHHKIDGTTSAETSSTTDPSHTYSVGDAIPAGDIEPDSSLITPDGTGQARYMLVTADGAADEKAPYMTLGGGAAIPDANTSHVSYLLHPSDTGLQFDGANQLTGNMVNRTLEVHYTYKPNPLYPVGARVKYIDAYGTNLTEAVITEWNATHGAGDPLHIEEGGMPNPIPDNKWYKDGSGNLATIYAKVGAGQSKDIPAPPLPDYEDDDGDVTLAISDNALEFQNDGGNLGAPNWGTGAGRDTHFTMTMGTLGTMVGFEVAYQRDPNSVASVVFGATMGGALTNSAGSQWGSQPTDNVTLVKNGAGNVVVDSGDLPIPTPDSGYMFDAWYEGSSGTTALSFPYELANPYTLEARFKRDPATWREYTFAIDSNSSTLLTVTGAYPKLQAKNIAGLATYTWGDAETDGTVPTVTPATGYDVVWYDSANNVMASAEDMLSRGGQTFTAYAVPNTPPVATDPVINSSGLDPATANPFIEVATTPGEHPALKYVIVDERTGEVLDVISSGDLHAASGMLQNKPYLNPGGRYKITKALPTCPVQPGEQISTYSNPDISANPAPANIPEVINESIAQDPNNQGKAKVTVPVITPNTEYALVDAAGNVISGFAQPGSAPLVYDNLDRDTTYRIVARPVGSAATEADRGPGYDINTNNLPVSATAFSVNLVYPAGENPTSVKIGGVVATEADLVSVDAGKTVEITAKAFDQSGNLFSKWHKVAGLTGSDVTISTITFTMPNRAVTLQVMYDVTGVTWVAPEYNGASGVHVANPYITAPGIYRVNVYKNPMSASAAFKSDIENVEAPDPYTGLFTLKAVVEKGTSSTGPWAVEATYTGDITATVDTGSLIPGKEYKLHLATNSNADNVTDSLATDFANPNYGGSFVRNLRAQELYGFGYISPQAFNISIVNVITGNVEGTLQKTSRSAVVASEYSSWITPSPHVTLNGVTWTYQGLSYSDTSYVPYDPNIRFGGDTTLYIYYDNDEPARTQAVNDLSDAIVDAKAIQIMGVKQPFARELADAIRDAMDLLARTSPTMATTAELNAMIAHLNAVKARAAANLSGTGGGSTGGGGGGGGSTGTRRGGGDKVTGVIKVGIDGNWELIDATNHKWVFNLTNSDNHKRLKGWAALSYTYEGETRVDWYHFADNNIMDSGWFKDESSGAWYYLSEEHDGFFGQMLKGWHHDPHDQKWYYLSPVSGAMITNWYEVSHNDWYYFNPTASAPTWAYDESSKKWEFKGTDVRPLGSMYSDEVTPDGYNVRQSGTWDRETP